MTGYVLSPEATIDLEDIYAYTVEVWGEAKARSYLDGLFEVFEKLVHTPMMGRARQELEDGLRSFPSGGHVVFYMLWEKDVAVVRVLHAARDVEKVFLG